LTNGQKRLAKTSLTEKRNAWCDLPAYVYTKEYEIALMEWLEKHVANGRTDIDTLVLYALHHETGDKMPYFEFDRSDKGVRACSEKS
jgi:hypothetical protein